MSGHKSLNILVAEDDMIIGELLAEMLIDMGHGVCAITTSEADTVAAAHQWHPDLLIVDRQLSPGSGVDAVDTIMRMSHIPHILVSGCIASLRRLRPDAIMLEKPYSSAALAMAIVRTSKAYQNGA